MSDRIEPPFHSPPRLLDLFCGAGGAAVGYAAAGFVPVGVDHRPQPRYPFTFIHADVFDIDWSEFDAIHASPPCQMYSRQTVMHDRSVYPDLIARTRQRLEEQDVPWVIENVPGAPLENYVQVCGSGLGMVRIRRHRWFESNIALWGVPCAHGQNAAILAVTGHSENGGEGKVGPGWLTVDRVEAMGIDWMQRDELSLAVPPAFTEFIGEQLIRTVMADAE
jgi:DNA (cytosine-5)-methyltransferase 1